MESIPFNELVQKAQTISQINLQVAKKQKKDIRVQFPARVISVDHTKQNCDIEILVDEIDDNGNVVKFPIIPNVPIRYTNETSVGYIRLPVQENDTGIIEFFDCDITTYLTQGVIKYHDDENYHTLVSGVYTSGFYPQTNLFPLSDVSNTTIEIGTKTGTFILNVDLSGNLTITAPTIQINAPTVDIDGLLRVTGTIESEAYLIAPDAVISGKNVNSHTHGGVMSGASSTAPF